MIIYEDCSKVELAPYYWDYEGLSVHYEFSSLD